MTALLLDTYARVRKLKATGLSEDQAEAITSPIRDNRDVGLANLVTKSDLAEAKFDIMRGVTGSSGFQTIVIGALSRAMH